MKNLTIFIFLAILSLNFLIAQDDSIQLDVKRSFIGNLTIKITHPQPDIEIDQSLILKNGARLIHLQIIQHGEDQSYLVGDVSKGSKIYALTLRKRGKKLIYITNKDELISCEAKNQGQAEFAYKDGKIDGCKNGKFSVSVGF